MKQFWKKTLWAALLTAAFALSATGCGDDKQPASSTANSASSAAQAADSSTASEETGSSAETNVFQYEMNDDGTISITGYQGMEAVLEVPSTVEANQNLTEVTLPEGLSEIGESAFMDCGSLTTVQIPETVAQIDRAAFAGCSALTSISLPETVSTVMEEAFTGCTSLPDLTVANASLEYDRWGLVEGSEPLGVTITCPSGSAIETWAAANGISTKTFG